MSSPTASATLVLLLDSLFALFKRQLGDTDVVHVCCWRASCVSAENGVRSARKRASSRRIQTIADKSVPGFNGASQSLACNSVCGLAGRTATGRRLQTPVRRQHAETIDGAVRVWRSRSSVLKLSAKCRCVSPTARVWCARNGRRHSISL